MVWGGGEGREREIYINLYKGTWITLGNSLKTLDECSHVLGLLGRDSHSHNRRHAKLHGPTQH